MIQPTYGVLQTIFADRVFRIPHYQRFYSWRRRQRQDLFSDIRKLVSLGLDQHHFMATLVCYRTAETMSVGTNQYRMYDIVDGQQRLTTLIILLKCIELALAEASPDREDLARILVKRDGILILLQTNNANERIFNRFLRHGIRPVSDELQVHSDHRLAEAIRECDAFVSEWKADDNLTGLMSIVLHRLGFVVHDTEDSRAVYTVFEVLNSRGLDVDWLDKTKSMLMGRAFELSASADAAGAEIGSLQHLWGDIYRELSKQDVPGDEILRVTATLYFGTGAGKPRSAEDSLDQLRAHCDTFNMPSKLSNRLLDCARKLTDIHGAIHLGPVTDILHARLLAVAIQLAVDVAEDERARLLDQWERVTFRIFGLCGKDARTKVGDYVRLAARVVGRDEGTRTYAQILSALQELGGEYPVEHAVNEGLVGRACYENSPELCRYVLWLYEEHLAHSFGSGATTDPQERAAIWRMGATDSIEHIFPQNPSGEPGWSGKMARAGETPEDAQRHVDRIGNLILLPVVVNQAARTKPFADKKATYERHNLRMIRRVCQEPDWTLDQIEAREAEIAVWARHRWADLDS
jgi:hypothetical protein